MKKEEAINSDSKSNGFHDDINEIDRPIIPSGEVRFIGCYFGQGGGDNIKTAKANENIVSVVRCKDCKHREHCYETVAHTKYHDGFIEHWSEPIEWCSRGERREE